MLPQLNPAPWFFTMSSSWAVMLSVLAPKVLTASLLSEPGLPMNQFALGGEEPSWF